jgi:hypothetical protein
MIARWCTRAVWAVSGLLLVSTLFGVPPQFAAAATVAVVLLVVGTVPLLMVAERAIPRMRRRAAELADLVAVRLTHEPAALARLLLTTAEDSATVPSRWQIANLWFDPDTERPRVGTMGRRVEPWLDGYDTLAPQSPERVASIARETLIERARVMVDLTGGDPKLRAEFDRVARGQRGATPAARSRASRRAAGG